MGSFTLGKAAPLELLLDACIYAFGPYIPKGLFFQGSLAPRFCIPSPSYDWMRKLTQRKKQVKKGKASLLFDHLEPMELAEHLTFLEYKSIRRISLSLFFPLSFFQKLLHLQNFNTLMAVVGGLSHSSISRLKETHAHLSADVTKMWSEMTDLVSSKGNYSAYRKAYNECEGFKIPILGVHLKDLIAVHVVFSDWIEESKLNLVKMQQLYITFKELMALQSSAAHVEPNMDLIYLLALSLDLYYTEDEIYDLSLLREPRNTKSVPTSPTTPNKTHAPLDWASGVTTKPDPSVVNKHIRKVVDSVFRNYDHDHDGYISQEDFESIAANFPFLDSFCVLDKDQDGLISKDEMMAYFLRANPVLQCKMGPGFIHNFQEITYLKPTFCEHCAGFLWGIIKQGYKCKDCGVNCHKQCRELLVLACRRLPRSTSLCSVSPGAHSSLPSSPTLPTSKDEDEVFEFPTVSPSGSDLERKSITLMTGSAQRISVRFQRATTSQATQTDPLWTDNNWSESGSGSHTFPKMRCRPHRKNSKNKGFARWDENETSGHERRETHKQPEEEQRNGVPPLHHHYTHDSKSKTPDQLTWQLRASGQDAGEIFSSAAHNALLSGGRAGMLQTHRVTPPIKKEADKEDEMPQLLHQAPDINKRSGADAVKKKIKYHYTIQ
ncbi:ras guanyl-releasing protein 3 [Silurus meridionalis]|nr:ras guanyl-releasing protein 3 [Silurus meridionalis]